MLKNKTQKNKSPLADNWKFSKKEIESLKQEAAAHDDNLIKQVVQKLENVQNTRNRGTGTESEKINEILEVKSFESLEKYITKELMKNTKIGKVTSTQGNTVTVQTEQEHREIKNAAPFGIISVPPIGAKAVVTPTEQGFIYTGVVEQNSELEPGELMLYSSGGANIILKNDGQVLINGTALE